MPEDVKGAEGAAGEPADSGAAVGSQPSGDEGAGAGGATTHKLDPEVLKQLESIDPRELPDGLRIRLEQPFLSKSTKRDQEFYDRERQLRAREERLLDIASESLNRRNVPTAPDKIAALKEKLRNGEIDVADALPEFVENVVSNRVDPQVNSMKVQGYFSDAFRDYPVLTTPEAAREVNDLFAQNKTLELMSRANGFEGTKLVLRGIAAEMMYRNAKADVERLKAEAAEVGKKAVEEYKRRALNLPAETARSGGSRSVATEDMDLRQAMEAAYEEARQKGR